MTDPVWTAGQSPSGTALHGRRKLSDQESDPGLASPRSSAVVATAGSGRQSVLSGGAREKQERRVHGSERSSGATGPWEGAKVRRVKAGVDGRNGARGKSRHGCPGADGAAKDAESPARADESGAGEGVPDCSDDGMIFVPGGPGCQHGTVRPSTVLRAWRRCPVAPLQDIQPAFPIARADDGADRERLAQANSSQDVGACRRRTHMEVPGSFRAGCRGHVFGKTRAWGVESPAFCASPPSDSRARRRGASACHDLASVSSANWDLAIRDGLKYWYCQFNQMSESSSIFSS
jgi:hypothetical protein